MKFPREPPVESSLITDALLARIEAKMEEYRAAERRGILKRAVALWERSEAAHRAAKHAVDPPLPEKIH